MGDSAWHPPEGHSCASHPVTARAGAGRGLTQGVGAAILRFCSNSKKLPCSKTDCWVQPMCACAREDMRASRRMEGRLWLAVAAMAGIVILIAVVWAHGNR